MKVAVAAGVIYRTKDGARLVEGEEINLPDAEALAHIRAGSMVPVAPKAPPSGK